LQAWTQRTTTGGEQGLGWKTQGEFPLAENFPIREQRERYLAGKGVMRSTNGIALEEEHRHNPQQVSISPDAGARLLWLGRRFQLNERGNYAA
jgi:hypothetical protein